MALSQVEKCAGRWFRERGEQALSSVLLEWPDSAPCSVQVSFYRHPCKAVKGRTRAIQLKPYTLYSPEIWVSWDDDAEILEVLSQAEAQKRLEAGQVVECETILAGKFSYTWKQGQCGHCDLIAISREGMFADERPNRKLPQNDLQEQQAWAPDIATLKREVGFT